MRWVARKRIVAQIVEKQGDYVISVKDNQEKLAEAVQPRWAKRSMAKRPCANVPKSKKVTVARNCGCTR